MAGYYSTGYCWPITDSADTFVYYFTLPTVPITDHTLPPIHTTIFNQQFSYP